jgi:hypothetical protein
VEAGGVKGRVEKGNKMVGKVFGGGSESGWLRCGAANEEGECRGIYNYKTHKADCVRLNWVIPSQVIHVM